MAHIEIYTKATCPFCHHPLRTADLEVHDES